MKQRNLLDLEKLWKAIRESGDTTSKQLSERFDCSSCKILAAVHKLEEMHPGQVMVHTQGISSCCDKSKEDIDRFLLTAGRYQSILRRERHIATHCLKPAEKRIGRALLIKAIPQQKLLSLESNIDFLAEQRRKENEGVVGHFDFDKDGKMKRGFSAGAGNP